MFTITDICNIAMQIECNGEKTYTSASEKSSSPRLSELFKRMAEEEKSHACWFGSIKLEQPILPEQRELENMGRKLLQDMVTDKTFSLNLENLAKAEKYDDVLEQLIAFEQDTVLFYDFLKNIIEDNATKEHLEKIIEEEYQHIERITEMAAVVKDSPR